MDGRLRLAVSDLDQVRRIVDLLHEKAISVGNDVVTILAVEDGIQKNMAKNSRRGGRSRAAPPAMPGS